jgi:hypothetical protein
MRHLQYLIFLSLVLLASNVSFAQNPKKHILLSVGQFVKNPVSTGEYHNYATDNDVSQVSTFSPQFAINLEYQFDKAFSGGIQLRYVGVQSERTITTSSACFFCIWGGGGSTTFNETAQGQGLGLDLTTRINILSENKYDIYTLINGGVFYGLENIKNPLGSGKPSQESQSRLWLALDAKFGLRYFLSDKFGVFSEFGYSRIGRPLGLNMSGGIIIR